MSSTKGAKTMSDELRVERLPRHENFAAPPPMTGGGVRQREGVWLECDSKRCGDFTPEMPTILRRIATAINELRAAIGGESPSAIAQLNRVADAVERVLQEAKE